MAEFLLFLICSFKAVGIIVLAIIAGFVAVKMKVFNQDTLRSMSKLLIFLLLPCLLFSKTVQGINLQILGELWIFPAFAAVYALIGLIFSIPLSRLLPEGNTRKIAIAASSFCNAGYIPMTLITAIAASFPDEIFNEASASSGIVCISAFILGSAVILWSLGYAIITGKSLKTVKWKNFISPPMTAIIFGFIFSVIPFLKDILCNDQSHLYFIFRTMSLLGSATLPLALIIIGGTLALASIKLNLELKLIFISAGIKLLLIPICGLLLIWLALNIGILAVKPLFIVVLIMEAASPMATNLLIMANSTDPDAAKTFAPVMFWSYLISAITIPVFITLALHIFC